MCLRMHFLNGTAPLCMHCLSCTACRACGTDLRLALLAVGTTTQQNMVITHIPPSICACRHGAQSAQQFISADGTDTSTSQDQQHPHRGAHPHQVANNAAPPPAGHPIWSDRGGASSHSAWQQRAGSHHHHHARSHLATAAEATADSGALFARLPPTPRGLSGQQWSSLLCTALSGNHTGGGASRSPVATAAGELPFSNIPLGHHASVSAESAALAQRYLSLTAPRPRQIAATADEAASPAASTASASPSAESAEAAAQRAASATHARAPSVEAQIQALPKHLLDSDSESEAGPAPGAAQQPSTPPAHASVRAHAWQGPRTLAARAQLQWMPAGALPHTFSSLSLHGDGRSALSHAAQPFMPRGAPATAGIMCAQDLQIAIARASSIAALRALLQQNERLLDGECVVVAMQRAAQLTQMSTGAPVASSGVGSSSASQAAALADDLAGIASVCVAALPLPRVCAFLHAYTFVGGAIDSVHMQSLLHSAAQATAMAPSLPALSTLVRCLQALEATRGHKVHESAQLAATAAANLLTTATLADLPTHAVPVCAAAMRLGDHFPAAAMSVFSHALCMHATQLSVEDLAECVRALAAAQSTDAALLSLVAGAFHARQGVRCLL